MLGPFAGVLHVSDGCAWSGVSVDVQEKPKELPVQPSTVESAVQLLEANPTQQYSEVPFGPEAAVLQSSEASAALGASLEVHENPYEPPVQPATLVSGEQLPELTPTQQYSVSPVVPATPAPHANEGSDTFGASAPVQE